MSRRASVRAGLQGASSTSEAEAEAAGAAVRCVVWCDGLVAATVH